MLTVALVVILMYNTKHWADALGTQSWVGNAGWTWLELAGIPAFGCAAFITVLALQQGLISRVLSLPPFILLGELSYAIYLIHVILVLYYGAHAKSFAVLPNVVALLGYLAISDPREQSIAELAEALLASRSAIAGAVKTLDTLGLIRRSRAAGERMDRIWIDMSSTRSTGFDVTEYREQGDLAREGLALLAGEPPERRAVLM